MSHVGGLRQFLPFDVFFNVHSHRTVHIAFLLPQNATAVTGMEPANFGSAGEPHHVHPRWTGDCLNNHEIKTLFAASAATRFTKVYSRSQRQPTIRIAIYSYYP